MLLSTWCGFDFVMVLLVSLFYSSSLSFLLCTADFPPIFASVVGCDTVCDISFAYLFDIYLLG